MRGKGPGFLGRVPLVALALILLAHPMFAAAGLGAVEGSKSQTVYYKLDPLGRLSEGSVEVLIRLSLPSGSERGDLVDRVPMVDPGTISPLLGTPSPSALEDFYGHEILIWSGVEVEPGDLEFRYTAQTSAPPPLRVNATIVVNGTPASATELEGGWYVEVSPGDRVNLTFEIENLRPTVRTDQGYGRPPLMYTLQVSLPKSHFAEPTGDPAPSIVFPTSDEWILSWVGVLWDKPERVIVSTRLRVSAPQGFIDLPAVTVQANYDATPVVEQLRSAEESLDEIIESLEQMNRSMAKLIEGMEELSFWLGESRMRLAEAERGLYQLADALEQASELSGEAAERANAAADQIDSALEGAGTALDVIRDLKERVKEFQQSYENLTSALEELLKGLNVTLPGPPPQAGIIGAVEAAESQVEAVLRKGSKVSSSMRTLAWAMENATASLSGAAEMARSSAKDVEALSQALSFAQSSVDRGVESAREGLEDLEARLSEAESQRDDVRLKISLAESPWSSGGLAEFAAHASTVEADTISTEEEGKWVTWAVSMHQASGTAAGLAIHFECGDPVSVSLLGPDGWVEGGWEDLLPYGVIFSEEDCVLYIPGPMNLSDSSPTNLSVLGMPIRLISTRPPVSAEADLVSGLAIEAERRVVLKMSLPTLAVGIPLAAREEGSPETLPPPIQEKSEVPIWPFALGAAAVAGAVMVVRLTQQRAEERRILLARVREMVSQLDELEEDIVDRLRELGVDEGD
ncbi:MAG: hypothetical protein QI223_07870 [Candidatus Korarchaeota archaeon]|nr:hypothetical protein [Candidatus Korarchaeota archaeon]